MHKNSQTEIRVSVDSAYLESLQDRLKLTNSTDVTRVVLSLLDWVTDELVNNRIVLSSGKDGKDPRRLVMPELSVIEVEAK